jgi:hypothetical protein
VEQPTVIRVSLKDLFPAFPGGSMVSQVVNHCPESKQVLGLRRHGAPQLGVKSSYQFILTLAHCRSGQDAECLAVIWRRLQAAICQSCSRVPITPVIGNCSPLDQPRG